MKFRPLIYLKNLILAPFAAWDFQLNALLGGSPFETVSERIGRIKISNDGLVPSRRWFFRFIDSRILEPLDKNHSIEAARTRSGSDGAMDRPEDLI